MDESKEENLNESYNIKRNENDDLVIFWPPINEKEIKPKNSSFLPQSIYNVQINNKFFEQRKQELESLRLRQEEKQKFYEKQFKAYQTQLYQKQLKEQNLNKNELKNAFLNDEDPENLLNDTNRNLIKIEITGDKTDFLNNNSSICKRKYKEKIVDDLEPSARNEILTSEEILTKDFIKIDLLKRREPFIEKISSSPKISRTGKRWQPPSNYSPNFDWYLNLPLKENTKEFEYCDKNNIKEKHNKTIKKIEEFKWEPFTYTPNYQNENKNFTPLTSPSFHNSKGCQSLDEAAKRQLRFVIQPLQDGSHRPKSAFERIRQAPAGGFIPHAPNTIKILNKNLTKTQDDLCCDRYKKNNVIDHSTKFLKSFQIKDVNCNLKKQNSLSSTSSMSSLSNVTKTNLPYSLISQKTSLNCPNKNNEVFEWNKIYELPPHSSTLTHQDYKKKKAKGYVLRQAKFLEEQLKKNLPPPLPLHQNKKLLKQAFIM